MKKSKIFERFTGYDEEENKYVTSLTISSQTLDSLEVNSDKKFEMDGPLIDQLANFENLMQEYQIKSFDELEKILKRYKKTTC